MAEPEDVQFECAICHKEMKGEPGKRLSACRLCGRLHCPDCVDEYGRCVECASGRSNEMT